MSAVQREPLTTLGEILFRQIHPGFFTSGRISSQVFEAPNSHEGYLSVDRSSLTTAGESYYLFTNGFQKCSAGVCGVTVSEAQEEGIDVWADPLSATEDHPENMAHALIDLSPFSQNQMKKRAGRLAQKARDRGMLYQPE